MKRLALPMILLISACSTPVQRPSDPAQDAAVSACRQDVERTMRYRERGQTMRVDEAESRLGSGAFTGSSLLNEQLGARWEQDRMMSECLRGLNPGTNAPATPAATPPAGGGRGS